MDNPKEDLERAQKIVEGMRAQLARLVEKLPYDAELAVDFRTAEEDAR